MPRSALIAIGFAVLLTALPAMAEDRHPGSGGLPAPPRQLPPAAQKLTAPDPANYSAQMAQSLGVRNGRIELTSPDSRHAYVPGISLGGGSILSLQWRP